ncbi:SCO1860 family LAETG-anchored protein [Streptomyces sp. NPDC048419]|uniref:SCO1860 family LAETG-anchored protein n=1 Tax=Streptomyces sp. NPDC048419 TaxID=3365547 RepID=UPI0037213E19
MTLGWCRRVGCRRAVRSLIVRQFSTRGIVTLNSSVSLPSVSARGWAALLVVGAFAVAPAAVGTAASAHTGDVKKGSASAAVLRTSLDVSRLGGLGPVPLHTALNEVNAPATAEKKALDIRLDGVEGGQPVSVLRADVATARAEVTHSAAKATTHLVHARVHVPGVPLLALVEVEQVTSTAICKANEQPVATSAIPGPVTVLGKRIPLTVRGTRTVEVPGVGTVQLALSNTETTSRTAAATALQLHVSIDPLKLNVARVEGTVTLAEASCTSAGVAGSPAAEPSAAAGPVHNDARPQSVGEHGGSNLAETGSTPLTPYLAGAAAVFIVAGGGSLALARARNHRRR